MAKSFLILDDVNNNRTRIEFLKNRLTSNHIRLIDIFSSYDINNLNNLDNYKLIMLHDSNKETSYISEYLKNKNIKFIVFSGANINVGYDDNKLPLKIELNSQNIYDNMIYVLNYYSTHLNNNIEETINKLIYIFIKGHNYKYKEALIIKNDIVYLNFLRGQTNRDEINNQIVNLFIKLLNLEGTYKPSRDNKILNFVTKATNSEIIQVVNKLIYKIRLTEL